MKRTEISLQLAEIKIEVIRSKTKFKKMTSHPEWRTCMVQENDNSEHLIQTFSSIIDQLSLLEKDISGRFLK